MTPDAEGASGYETDSRVCPGSGRLSPSLFRGPLPPSRGRWRRCGGLFHHPLSDSRRLYQGHHFVEVGKHGDAGRKAQVRHVQWLVEAIYRADIHLDGLRHILGKTFNLDGRQRVDEIAGSNGITKLPYEMEG